MRKTSHEAFIRESSAPSCALWMGKKDETNATGESLLLKFEAAWHYISTLLKLTIFSPSDMEGKNMVGVWRENENVKLEFLAGGKKSENTMSQERESWMGESERSAKFVCERRGKLL